MQMPHYWDIETLGAKYVFDRTMLPYYCNEYGVHIARDEISNPTIIPHVLIRMFDGAHEPSIYATHAIIVGNKITIVNYSGDQIKESYINIPDTSKIRNYVNNTSVNFLNEIKVTCAMCQSVVSRPNATARGGKEKYHHILCANCAGMLPKQL